MIELNSCSAQAKTLSTRSTRGSCLCSCPLTVFSYVEGWCSQLGSVTWGDWQCWSETTCILTSLKPEEGKQPAGGRFSRKERKSSNGTLCQVVHGLTLSSGLCVWLWGVSELIRMGSVEWRIAWESIGSTQSQRRGYTDAPNPSSPLSD